MAVIIEYAMLQKACFTNGNQIQILDAYFQAKLNYSITRGSHYEALLSKEKLSFESSSLHRK